MRHLLLATVLFFPLSLHARPPEHPDPSLRGWYEGLTQPGTGFLCCSEADCRPADYRVNAAGHFEVFIDKGRDRFGPLAPDAWVVVEDDHVIRGHDNPVGQGVACWIKGMGVMCFLEASGA